MKNNFDSQSNETDEVTDQINNIVIEEGVEEDVEDGETPKKKGGRKSKKKN